MLCGDSAPRAAPIVAGKVSLTSNSHTGAQRRKHAGLTGAAALGGTPNAESDTLSPGHLGEVQVRAGQAGLGTYRTAQPGRTVPPRSRRVR